MAIRARAKASLLQAAQEGRRGAVEREQKPRAQPYAPLAASPDPCPAVLVKSAPVVAAHDADEDDVMTSSDERTRRNIIAHAARAPSSSSKSLRTVWTTASDLGRGFFRDTNQYAPVAVTCTDARNGATPASRQQQTFNLVETAADFASTITAEGDIAAEGWGASVSACYDLSTGMTFTSTALTAVLRRSHVSEPVLVVQPARDQLTETAVAVLADSGPLEFHRKYGWHFVAGYTVGGVFLGSFQVLFTSAAAAAAYRTYFQASISRFSSSESATSEFVAEMENCGEYQRTEVAYHVSGWRGKTGPTSVRDLESLFRAAEEMEVDGGERLDAILMPYDVLESYQAALKNFSDTNMLVPRNMLVMLSQTNTPDTDHRQVCAPDTVIRRQSTTQPQDASDGQLGLDVSVASSQSNSLALCQRDEEFAMVAQLLTQEFLYLHWLQHVTTALIPKEVERTPHVDLRVSALVWKLIQRKQLIRRKFSAADSATSNWHMLSAYVHAVLWEEEYTPPDVTWVSTGKELAEAVFTYDTLHKELDDLRKCVAVVWEVGFNVRLLQSSNHHGRQPDFVTVLDVDWEDGAALRGFHAPTGEHQVLEGSAEAHGTSQRPSDGFVHPPQIVCMHTRFTEKPGIRPTGVKFTIRDRSVQATAFAEHRFSTLIDDSATPPAVYNRYDQVTMVVNRVGTGDNKFRAELTLKPISVLTAVSWGLRAPST